MVFPASWRKWPKSLHSQSSNWRWWFSISMLQLRATSLLHWEAWMDACLDPVEKCETKWHTNQHILVSERTHRFDTGTNLQKDQSTKSGKQVAQVGLLLLVTASPACLLGMVYSIYESMYILGPRMANICPHDVFKIIQKGSPLKHSCISFGVFSLLAAYLSGTPIFRQDTGQPSWTRRGGAKEIHHKKKALKTLMHLTLYNLDIYIYIHQYIIISYHLSSIITTSFLWPSAIPSN